MSELLASWPPAGPTDGGAVRDQLSVALIEARNRTLNWLTKCADATGSEELAIDVQGLDMPPRWLAGHLGWLAERWIGRNVRRSQGAFCPPAAALPSIDAGADAVWDPRLCAPGQREAAAPPMAATRAYLLDVLESTLDLLAAAPSTEAGLYFFFLALAHEERRLEDLQVVAQECGWVWSQDDAPPVASRLALQLPATHWRLGSGDGGHFCFSQETGQQELDIPEFEIDAQAVTWQQFSEFVHDGGYDREALWTPEGWAWVQALGRRAPRYVEQIGIASAAGVGGAVHRRQRGCLVRVAGPQAVMHVSWWEADAWARWAGRRLPSEAEWEVAADRASLRGFHWGAVREWTAGRLRPWPGFRADPWSAGSDLDPQPAFGRARVLRGASWSTPVHLRRVSAREFAMPDNDRRFVGFRTCAL